MATYNPKRKTDSGIEEVKFPLSSVEGLESALDAAGGYFGTCSSTSNTINKVVSCDNFVLEENARIIIYFYSPNTADYPKLNVNNTGNYPIYYNRNFLRDIENGIYYEFIFKNNAWYLLSSLDGLSRTSTIDACATDFYDTVYEGYGVVWSNDCIFMDKKNDILGNAVIRQAIPINAGSGINFSSDGETVTISATGSGGGGNGMPQIRFCNAQDTNGTMIINVDNPLTFTFEIVGGGELKVGDRLEICERKLATFNEGTKRKYRLRRFMEYTFEEGDFINGQPRFIKVLNTLEKGTLMRRLIRTNDNISQSHYTPIYARIHRATGKNAPENDAAFSNIVTMWRNTHCYPESGYKIFIK